MSEKLKAFVVGCFGGGIGSLVALEASPYLWWLGLIVGGLVGYIGYDPRAALSTFRSISRAEFRTRVVPVARAAIQFLVVIAVVFIYVTALMGPWIYLGYLTDQPCLLSVAIGFGSIMCFCGAAGFFRDVLDVDIDPTKLTRNTEDPPVLVWVKNVFWGSSDFVNWKEAWRDNPLTIALLVVPLCTLGAAAILVTMLCMLIVLLSIACGNAIAKTFVAIHSDARVVAAFFSTLGALAGYFAGSVFVGAATGGLLAVIDLAFLRQRLLATKKV